MKPESARDKPTKSEATKARLDSLMDETLRQLDELADWRQHSRSDVAPSNKGHPPSLTEVFERIVFALRAIAETAHFKGPKITQDLKRDGLVFWDALPPIQCKKRDVVGHDEGVVRTRLIYREVDDSVFSDQLRRESEDVLHASPRGRTVVRLGAKSVLEFCVWINAEAAPKTTNPKNISWRQARSEAFAMEFLTCWMMYDEIRENLQTETNWDSLKSTPSWHPEKWAVWRLLCSPKQLRESFETVPDLNYWTIVKLCDEPVSKHKKFFHYWENQMCVSRTIVINAIASYLIEDYVRCAMARFGHLLDKPTLSLEDLKLRSNDERLKAFWNALADEGSFGNREEEYDERKFRASVIRIIENAITWSKLTHSQWGHHFCASKGSVMMDG